MSKVENLTDELIINGIDKSIDNARKLFNEATILEKHGHKERAYTLYQFCIEEFGKVGGLTIAWTSLKQSIPVDYRELNYFFNGHIAHKKKTKDSIMTEIFIWGKILENDHKTRKEIIKGLLDAYDNVEQYNNKKNESLYVSFVNNTFVSPSESVSADMLGDMSLRCTLLISHWTSLIYCLKQTIDEVATMLNEIKKNGEEEKYFKKLVDEISYCKYDVIN